MFVENLNSLRATESLLRSKAGSRSKARLQAVLTLLTALAAGLVVCWLFSSWYTNGLQDTCEQDGMVVCGP
jgi:hypothetical protein